MICSCILVTKREWVTTPNVTQEIISFTSGSTGIKVDRMRTYETADACH
jgi:hypothetical protein